MKNNDNIKEKHTGLKYLEVYIGAGETYLDKYDYEKYTGKKVEGDISYVHVGQAVIDYICAKWHLIPRCSLIKVREREIDTTTHNKKDNHDKRSPCVYYNYNIITKNDDNKEERDRCSKGDYRKEIIEDEVEMER